MSYDSVIESRAQRLLDRSNTPAQFLAYDDPLRIVYELLNGNRDIVALEEECERLESEVSDLNEKIAQHEEAAEEIDGIVEELAGAAATINQLAESVKRLEAYTSAKTKRMSDEDVEQAARAYYEAGNEGMSPSWDEMCQADPKWKAAVVRCMRAALQGSGR